MGRFWLESAELQGLASRVVVLFEQGQEVEWVEHVV